MRPFASACVLSLLIGPLACAQPTASGSNVLAKDAHLTVPVWGLEATKSRSEIVAADGPGFSRALRVQIGGDAADSNATQLTLPNATRVEKGDVLLAELHLRGKSESGAPAIAMFLFERSASPWTKSVSASIEAHADAAQFRKSVIAFQSAETYAPGEAMASIRLAFGRQTVELAGVSIVNFGKSRTLDDVQRQAVESMPLGDVRVIVDTGKTFQTMRGLGGNFCQPRYGHNEPMDAVGRLTLDGLNVVHARIGVPLEVWAPSPGVYREEGPARAALQQLELFAKRGIPTVASVWEGPTWLLPGAREQSGKVMPKERYADCAEAIAQFLVKARDAYGAEVEYFSFNEPDYGVNFKFSGKELADFIAIAGPRFAALGLNTKFLVSDSANGSNLAAHAVPLLEDARIAKYLGPISFHSWDALTAPDSVYKGIADLGKRFGKEVWCLEAGHDSALWQAESPWDKWDNALRTAQAYARTILLTGATLMDYWTYQDNYPLADKSGTQPYPVFEVMRLMDGVFAKGSRVIEAAASSRELVVCGTLGPNGGRVSLLLVNTTGTGRAMLSGLPKNAKVAGTLRQANQQPKTIDLRTDADGRLTLDLPTQAIIGLSV